MSGWRSRLVIVVLLWCLWAGTASAAPTIAIVETNPVSENNAGEYVVIDPNGDRNVSGWRLSDGSQTVILPNVTIEEPTAISGDPRMTALLTEKPVLEWEGFLALATEGTTIELTDASGNELDSVTVPALRERERWQRNGGDGEATIRDPNRSGEVATAGNGTAFVLPDGAHVPDETIAEADDRLWVAGYEFTDPAILDRLRERHAAGVDVRVLLDGSPVGGQSAIEQEMLDTLVADGIPVRVLEGARDRFRFHHPKYAIVDDRVVVMTENWKPAGTGGASSRGWGVTLDDPSTSATIAGLFADDFGGRDTVAWPRADRGGTQSIEPANGSFDPQFAPESVAYESVELAISPRHARDAIQAVIADAEDEIMVQQVQIGDADFPLLQSLLEAADRGVEVRILLDSQWYVADENAALADRLNEASAKADLPVSVRLVDPGEQFTKIHTKGMVVDGETTVVGSMNWNNVSMTENREVTAIITSTEMARYFGETFAEDWDRAEPTVPIGLIGATVTIWVIVGLLARRLVSFDASV